MWTYVHTHLHPYSHLTSTPTYLQADGSPEALEKLKVLEANKKWTTDELW